MGRRSIDELVEILRNYAEEAGVSELGRLVFERDTGVRESEWKYYGLSWGEYAAKAGISTKTLSQPRDEEVIALRMIDHIRACKEWPATQKLRALERAKGGGVAQGYINRHGVPGLRKLVRDYCKGRLEYSDVYELCRSSAVLPTEDDRAPVPTGHVYLLTAGRNVFKLGKTNNVGRRAREIGQLVPYEVNHVHDILTVDPDGVEAYWKRRWQGKAVKGSEFYKLSASEVREFKGWKKIA